MCRCRGQHRFCVVHDQVRVLVDMWFMYISSRLHEPGGQFAGGDTGPGLPPLKMSYREQPQSNPCQTEGERVNDMRVYNTAHIVGIPKACALQACLSKNPYNPERCDNQLRALYLCCAQMYAGNEGKRETPSCPMPSVVERWLRSHPSS